MAKLKPTKISSIFRKKSIWISLFIIALALSVTTGVLTYYGQQVGNFVVGVTDDGFDNGLLLSKEPDFTYGGPRLVGDSVADVHPITFLDIYTDKVLNTNGSYVSNSGNYMGFTFYLKNKGTMSINVDLTLSISKATKFLDRATWVWLFEGEEDQEGTIYHKEDTIHHNYPKEYNDFNIQNFQNDELITKSSYVYFKPEEVKRFSIILWLEGEDPDCTDVGEYSIKNGMIRFTMRFDVVSEDAYISGGEV